MRNWSKRSLRILIAVLSVILTLLSATAGVMAKYIKDVPFSASVTIKAELGTVAVLEHQAVRQDDGSYDLGTAEVATNSYTLIPGLDIPKDPFVTVTNKSPIEAYVFVEVVDTLGGSAVSYQVDTDNWTDLGITGQNGGTVYVYKDKVAANIGPIYILKDNKVTVGQELLHGDTTDLGLTFYACMGQAAAGADAKAVYTALFTTP